MDNHQYILSQIKKVARYKGSFHLSQNYSGSSHLRYGISNPESWSIVRAWVREHKQISPSDLLDLINSLYKADSVDEKKIAGQILYCLPNLRSQIDPKVLDSWLEDLEGWEEIDSLCQSVFTAKDMLSNWIEWEKLIREFVASPLIQKRRASLVLLTNVVSQSNDIRFANLAFENINRLKGEKDILITKAISWLLRDLIKNHRERVKDYLDMNADLLPRIAIREVINKLTTGKK